MRFAVRPSEQAVQRLQLSGPSREAVYVRWQLRRYGHARALRGPPALRLAEHSAQQLPRARARGDGPGLELANGRPLSPARSASCSWVSSSATRRDRTQAAKPVVDAGPAVRLDNRSLPGGARWHARRD